LSQKIQEKLLNSFEMKPFPENISKLMELVRDPEVDSKAVAKLIESDPAMVARVLRMVNSPMMGSAHTISRIDQSIAFLGLNRIKSLAYVHAAAAVMSAVPGSSRDLQEIWRHSLACAVAARTLGIKWKLANVDEAFLAGVFHDFGKFFFFQVASEFYPDLYQNYFGVELLEQETRLMGINHQEAGSRLALFWNMPESVRVAISFHHQPAKAIAHEQLTLIVYLADYLVRAWGIGTPPPATPLPSPQNGLDEINLEDFEPLRIAIKAEYDQM